MHTFRIAYDIIKTVKEEVTRKDKGDTMKQTFTSRETSINSVKAPAIYGMKKAIEIMKGKYVIDIGGGRYDTAIEVAKEYNAEVSIYDPFNRSVEHNRMVLDGIYDVAVISNVLNVIDSKEARADVLRCAAGFAETILITVYEGDRSGKGKQTGVDSWQENRCTSDYVDEIRNALGLYDVIRCGKLIIATFKY